MFRLSQSVRTKMEKIGGMLFDLLLSVILPMILYGWDFIVKVLREELFQIFYVSVCVFASGTMPCAHQTHCFSSRVPNFLAPTLLSGKGHVEHKSMGYKQKWCASPVAQAIKSRSDFTLFLFSSLSAGYRGSIRNSGALGDNTATKWKEPWCHWRQPTEHLIGDAEAAVIADSLP